MKLTLTQMEAEVLACLTTNVGTLVADIAEDLVECPRGKWVPKKRGEIEVRAQAQTAIGSLRKKLAKELKESDGNLVVIPDKDPKGRVGRKRGYRLSAEAYALAREWFAKNEPEAITPAPEEPVTDEELVAEAV